MLTVIALLILVALVYRCAQAERDYHYRTQRDREAKEERARRRELAQQALTRAIEFLDDPRNRELDYALGTGHQVERAERIVAAKTWDELEAIACGDDLEAEKDHIRDRVYFSKRKDQSKEG